VEYARDSTRDSTGGDTMRIDVRGQSFGLTPAIETYAERKFETALDRFANRISTVTVRLFDDNGPRGGVDKRCLAELTMPRSRGLMIDEPSNDLYAAIDAAAERASRAVARAIGRRRAKRSLAAEYREAERTGISRRVRVPAS